MNYIVKPIVCDYQVIDTNTKEMVCMCNIKSNADLIADILNVDSDNEIAYSYECYPYAKYKIVKAESEEEE